MTVSWKCSICERNTAHNTSGIQKEKDGREYQTLECTVCARYVKAYLGENGELYQENLEAPEDTEADNTEVGKKKE